MRKACALAVFFILSMMTLVTGQMPSGSLYLHFPFEGNYNDASGRNKTALPSGTPVFMADRSGNAGRALFLDGVDDFVTCNNSGDFDCTVDYSVSIWFKADSADKPQRMCLISKNGLDGRDDCRAQFNLEIVGNDSGRLHYFMGDNILGHGHAVSIFGGKMVSHVWTHVAVTMKGDTARLYVNGEIVDSAPFIGTGRVMAFENVQVGRYSNDDPTYPVQLFQGAVDDVRLYARALTASEVMTLSTETPRTAIPSDSIYSNQIGMKFKKIPAGSFQMGWEGRRLTTAVSRAGLFYGLYNERPAHQVAFSSDFFIGTFEVTNRQFKQFRSNHGNDIAWYPGGDSLPVSCVTWFAADSFCKWLTANDPNGYQYRLPTEAEWEYACRAGTQTWFWSGDSISSTQENLSSGWGSSITLQNVGKKQSNPWGLYDMQGNAREWCLDWFGPYTASAKTDPGGYDRSQYKVWRGCAVGAYFFMRSAARGGCDAGDRSGGLQLGFRVVISGTNLNYAVLPDTVAPYSIGIAAAKPPVSVSVSGEQYVDTDGREFIRTRITRMQGHYVMQKDSVVYVSVLPIGGDSGTTRKMAGLYAKNLSQRLGVLYRISNRYERSFAGKTASQRQYYLTILPDIKYPEGCFGHPDVAQYVFRRTPAIPALPESLYLGDIHHGCNNCASIEECDNGDILGCWYSGTTEDFREQNIAGSRLRLGASDWDNATLFNDVPLISDHWMELWNDGRGNLFKYVAVADGYNTYVSVSNDNGKHWQHRGLAGPVSSIKGQMTRLGGDTVVSTAERTFIVFSYDGGFTWKDQKNTPTRQGYHPSLLALDNGSILVFRRGDIVRNSDSLMTLYSAITSDRGQTWRELPTPFNPPGIGQYNVALKLQSGRMLFALHCNVPNKGGVILAESEDDGKTWFCRRKLGYFGYMDMCQGKDGTIHLLGTNGSCGGGQSNGFNPQVSFNEQWLREGTCLDIADWGINTAGMVANGCPSDDSMPTVGTESADYAATNATFPALQVSAVPNPFNPSTTIRVNMPENEHAELSIFNVTGKAIRHWTVKGGNQQIAWNGRDLDGKAVPSGFYFLVMKTSSNSQLTKRIVLLK